MSNSDPETCTRAQKAMPAGTFARTWAAMSREWICPCGRIERHTPQNAFRAGWLWTLDRSWGNAIRVKCPACVEKR